MTLSRETPNRSVIETHTLMSLTMHDMLNKRNHNSQRGECTQYLMGTLHWDSETWRRPDSCFDSRRWGSSVWHLTLKKKKKNLSPWLLNANKKDLSEWGDWVTVSFSMTKSRTDRTQICTYHWGFIFCPSRGGNLYYYMSKKTLYQRNRILKKMITFHILWKQQIKMSLFLHDHTSSYVLFT